MKYSEKYNKLGIGLVSGFVFPLIVGLIIYLFSAHGRNIIEYLERIKDANIITHAITLCVFPNIIIFLLFNRFDMLKALKGILASTIVWAITVFIVKIL